MKRVPKYKHEITKGCMLVVDPASGRSSKPGYAVFRGGKMVTNGVATEVGGADIATCLTALHEWGQQMQRQYGPFEVLAIEKIRGRMAHVYLTWAVGVTIQAVTEGLAVSPIIIEVPITPWRAYAKRHLPDWTKGDAEDAKAMGEFLLYTAHQCG